MAANAPFKHTQLNYTPIRLLPLLEPDRSAPSRKRENRTLPRKWDLPIEAVRNGMGRQFGVSVSKLY